TCLINLYGSRLENDKRYDTARVGEHKDFEPGPVASVSFGERALFQFVESRGRMESNNVVYQQWLEERSLQVFGGKAAKEDLFHRVQRVDRKEKVKFELQIPNFEVRRINFTFRYVPDIHILSLKDFPKEKLEDIEPYIKKLAEHSKFFKAEYDNVFS